MSDVLFHLGYKVPEDGKFLKQLLGNIRFILLCGTHKRAQSICDGLHAAMGRKKAASKQRRNENHCRTERYGMYVPTREVLVVSHGIGVGSAETVLHEVIKALRIAGVEIGSCEGRKGSKGTSTVLIRLGSCGGLGVPPGSIVVTRHVLNGELKPVWRTAVLGEAKEIQVGVDKKLSHAILQTAKHSDCAEAHVLSGDTICADSFYLGQGRVDGAYTLYTPHQRNAFMRKCHALGVRNFEMESLAVAGIATHVNIPAAVVCVTLVDRLQEDTPSLSDEQQTSFEERGVRLIVNYVVEQLEHDP